MMSIREHLLSIIWIICLVRKKGSGGKNLNDGKSVVRSSIQVVQVFASQTLSGCSRCKWKNDVIQIYRLSEALLKYRNKNLKRTIATNSRSPISYRCTFISIFKEKY